MISRRDFLQVAAAAAAVTGLGGAAAARRGAAAPSGRRTCCGSRPKGQLTLLHMADCHAQLKPLYYREPSLNLGVGDASGQLPHLTGARAAGALRHPDRLAPTPTC